MSDLPDLPTDNISYIAYWNAIDDGGVGSIDPEDVLSDGNINSYTLYDNGIQIDSYSTVVGRNCKARVKSDGWVIAYFDRTEELVTKEFQHPNGWWDIANDWGVVTSASSYTNNSLERVISQLQTNLSNSGTIQYNPSDIALFNYEHPDATNLTGMSLPSANRDTNSLSGGFSYTSDTTIHAAVAVGSAYSESGDWVTVTFEGLSIASCDPNEGDKKGTYHGSIDLLGEGVIPDPGTEYSGTLTAPNTFDYQYAGGNLDVLIQWS